MNNTKTVKDLKKEIKVIDKKIYGLEVEKQKIESKGCFSDHELDERDKKINGINKETVHLHNEKEYMAQNIVNLALKKWLEK